MKQTKLLFALFMAIVMMAMSPGRAWGQNRLIVNGNNSGDYEFDENGEVTLDLTAGQTICVELSTQYFGQVTCTPTSIEHINGSDMEVYVSYSYNNPLRIGISGKYKFVLSGVNVDEEVEEEVIWVPDYDDEGNEIDGHEEYQYNYTLTDACATLNISCLSAEEHQHVYNQEEKDLEGAQIKAETCTEKGIYKKSCTCGALGTETFEVDALGHLLVYSGNTVAVPATCTENAQKYKTCDRCGYVSDTETFEAYGTKFGHDWADAGDGEHHACQREGCGTQEEHAWRNGTCTVCQATDPNFVGVTVDKSSGGFDGEGPENLFDGDPSTKWCSRSESDLDREDLQFYVIFHPSKRSVLASYTLVDANDTDIHENRKWSSWVILGSDDKDADEWVVIDQQDDKIYYSGETFTIDNPTAYNYYKLKVIPADREEVDDEVWCYIQQMADMNITWSCAHDFTSKTLTTEPVADGLYAYACDRGCGAHSDDHIVKASEGESTTTIELTDDGEGNFSAASVEVADGKAFETPVTFTVTADQVTVDRTFTADKPASQMLPFTVPASQISGATFFEFGGVSFNETTQKWEATMTAVITGNLEAYKPYMVVPAAASITFGTSAQSATFPVTSTSASNMEQSAAGWTFEAVNTTKTWSAGDADLGRAYGFAAAGHESEGFTEGQFVMVGAGASAAPGRCYLLKDTADPLTRAGEELPTTIGIRFVVGSTTGIGTLDTETGAFTFDGWYDLQGNRVSEPMQGGVMIKNNKKVMVK